MHIDKDAILKVLKEEGRISAIKLVKNSLVCRLKTAKLIVDELEEHLPGDILSILMTAFRELATYLHDHGAVMSLEDRETVNSILIYLNTHLL